MILEKWVKMKLKSRFFLIMGKFDQLRDYIWPVILVLGIIVFLTFLWAIVVLLFPSLLPKPNGLSVLPAISISAGVLIAIVTFLGDRERNSSKVFLERAIVGFDTVVDLLSDQNNNRITWVHAARTLIQTLDLDDQIKSLEYKRAFKLEAEKTRAKLHQALSWINLGEALPGQFFYGSPDWAKLVKEGITLDDAAIKVSNKIEAIRGSIDSISPLPALLPLSVKSVIAIYDFLKYPEDYSDPLDSVKDWDSDWYTLDFDQGAKSYVAHKKMKYTIDGKLHDRKSQETDN